MTEQQPADAKTYDVGDPTKYPTIDGQRVPWFVSVSPGPMVEPIEDGSHLHILWLPIIVAAPMPTPPAGRPDAEPVSKGDA